MRCSRVLFILAKSVVQKRKFTIADDNGSRSDEFEECSNEVISNFLPENSLPEDLPHSYSLEKRFHFKSTSHESVLVKNLIKSIENADFTDVILVAEEKRIKVHRLVISAYSSYFKVRIFIFTKVKFLRFFEIIWALKTFARK